MNGVGMAFLAGALFAVGLGISGMTSPDKVVGFLDVLGAWDPSLAMVMVGAIGVMAVAWRVRPRLAAPLLGGEFKLPDRKDVDPRLVAGAALFGVGWGLAGYCPGPALVSVPTLRPNVLAFVGAMAAGMMIVDAFEALLARRAAVKPAAPAP